MSGQLCVTDYAGEYESKYARDPERFGTNTTHWPPAEQRKIEGALCGADGYAFQARETLGPR